MYRYDRETNTISYEVFIDGKSIIRWFRRVLPAKHYNAFTHDEKRVVKRFLMKNQWIQDSDGWRWNKTTNNVSWERTKLLDGM